MVDPDNGENCHRKLAATYIPGSVSGKLFQSVPSVEDTQWTTRLYNIPKITFSTIYDYLVDQKLVIKKVACLESVVDKRAEAVRNNDEKVNVVELSTNGESIEYTRTLDKAYRFFQDGHVQNIKYHPLPDIADHICISAVVLPSMQNDHMYNVSIFIHESAWVAAHVLLVYQDVVIMSQQPFTA